MEVSFENRAIKLNRVESSLDSFVLSYCSILKKHAINYVIVSGYVAIVFGRSRQTEDVDILFEDCGQARFGQLFADALANGFACLNAQSSQTAYCEYLKKGTAIRFARQGSFIPNIEFKMLKTGVERETLDEKVKLLLNGNELHISPLELQIAYELYLGSEKDIEDAIFLYELFKERLDGGKLKSYAKHLSVKSDTLSLLVGK